MIPKYFSKFFSFMFQRWKNPLNLDLGFKFVVSLKSLKDYFHYSKIFLLMIVNWFCKIIISLKFLKDYFITLRLLIVFQNYRFSWLFIHMTVFESLLDALFGIIILVQNSSFYNQYQIYVCNLRLARAFWMKFDKSLGK